MDVGGGRKGVGAAGVRNEADTDASWGNRFKG